MSQKRLMAPFNLSIGQKMLRFWKMTLETSKIWKLPIALVTSNFQ